MRYQVKFALLWFEDMPVGFLLVLVCELTAICPLRIDSLEQIESSLPMPHT